MLPMMAQNLDILGLHQCLVVSFVSYAVGHAGCTVERLEMVAAKVGNCTLAENEFDLWVARIGCLCLVYFQHYYLMFRHWHLDIVVSQKAHRLEPYLLPSVEIHLSTSYVNKRMVVKKLSLQLAILKAAEYGWEHWRYQWPVAEWRPLISIFVVTDRDVSLHYWSHATWRRKRNHSHTHPAVLYWCSNSHGRMFR